MLNLTVGRVIIPNCLMVIPGFLSPIEASSMLGALNVELQGQIQPTSSGARLMSRHGETYTYMNRPLPVFPCSPTLLTLKDRVVNLLGCDINAAVVNRYPTGEHFVDAHNDTRAIPQLGKEPIIPCVSFGASRPFVITPRKKGIDPTTIVPGHGDLVVMFGESQREFLHSVPKDPSCVTCRLSVTFRFHAPKV
jgi:hypothetical protein